MNAQTEQTIREVFLASHEGRIHFGRVVETLLGIGMESYQVDYRACRTTYYGSDETLTLDQDAPEVAIADDFDKADLQAAIVGSQQGRVLYPEFKRLSQAAGCIGYTVWLTGRHVSYFGRKGEVHVERFPD